MNINITHIALYAVDLEKSKEFYTKYFNGVSNQKYTNSKGFSSYFITYSSGARLELMSHTELEFRPVIDKVNGWSHVAFSVGSKEEVLRITNQIVNDGYELYSAPRDTGDGYYESAVADPDGNRVEITI